MGKHKFTELLTACLISFPAFIQASCPDLTNYFSLVEDQPGLVRDELLALTTECEASTEFFALLGSSQLALGDLLRAAENLELALLIDPENGSAMVDYAEVLFGLGQVSSAVDINQLILERGDLPQGLAEQLVARKRRWSAVNQSTNFNLAASAGHDSNLNSAPFDRELALTLSGESIVFAVSPEFRPTSGEYANLAFGGTHSRVGQNYSVRISGQMRGRFSSQKRYDIIQAATQFVISESGDNGRWALQADAGTLNFGSNSIFNSVTLRGSYLLGRIRACGIYPRLAVQYQSFRLQRILSGVETSLGFGLDCFQQVGRPQNRLGIEFVALKNNPTQSGRLGGERNGWQTNIAWQRGLKSGDLLLQYSHAKLNDELGFSNFFKNGAKRRESLNSAILSYSVPLQKVANGLRLTFSAYYQEQRNTISLFRFEGTSAEMGLSLDF